MALGVGQGAGGDLSEVIYVAGSEARRDTERQETLIVTSCALVTSAFCELQ